MRGKTALMRVLFQSRKTIAPNPILSRPLFARKSVIVVAPAIVTGKGLAELIGKAVFFESKGERIAGKVAGVEGTKLAVLLAVPNSEGLLMVSATERMIESGDIEVTNALMSEKRLATFEAGIPISLPTDRKFATIFEQDETGKATSIVCDYQNVIIEGFASTFMGTTPIDRGGDYIIPGAFDKTLADFMKNPVLLSDHDNSVSHLAGSFSKVGITKQGLAVSANVSNAPGMRDTRFKLIEGHLKGLSIGGIWYYADDNRGIEEATVWEISLTPVPMNPDALVRTRSVTAADCRKAFKAFFNAKKVLKAA